MNGGLCIKKSIMDLAKTIVSSLAARPVLSVIGIYFFF